jgi:hypothetical protein
MKKAKKQTSRGRKQDRARVAGGQNYEMSYESKKTAKRWSGGPPARGLKENQPEVRAGAWDGKPSRVGKVGIPYSLTNLRDSRLTAPQE